MLALGPFGKFLKVENRRKDTDIPTFHSRDVYAYTGAKLASSHISFEEVGPELKV